MTNEGDEPTTASAHVRAWTDFHNETSRLASLVNRNAASDDQDTDSIKPDSDLQQIASLKAELKHSEHRVYHDHMRQLLHRFTLNASELQSFLFEFARLYHEADFDEEHRNFRIFTLDF